jgi:hypothetical protein
VGRALVTLVLVGGFALVVAAGVWGVGRAMNAVSFNRDRNKIRLDQLRRQSELDLKLSEWQQTKSLEDLERHRQRLEAGLDEMHSDMRREPPAPGSASDPGPAK